MHSRIQPGTRPSARNYFFKTNKVTKPRVRATSAATLVEEEEEEDPQTLLWFSDKYSIIPFIDICMLITIHSSEQFSSVAYYARTIWIALQLARQTLSHTLLRARCQTFSHAFKLPHTRFHSHCYTFAFKRFSACFAPVIIRSIIYILSL